jgi:hypothetical protein
MSTIVGHELATRAQRLDRFGVFGGVSGRDLRVLGLGEFDGRTTVSSEQDCVQQHEGEKGRAYLTPAFVVAILCSRVFATETWRSVVLH